MYHSLLNTIYIKNKKFLFFEKKKHKFNSILCSEYFYNITATPYNHVKHGPHYSVFLGWSLYAWGLFYTQRTPSNKLTKHYVFYNFYKYATSKCIK